MTLEPPRTMDISLPNGSERGPLPVVNEVDCQPNRDSCSVLSADGAPLAQLRQEGSDLVLVSFDDGSPLADDGGECPSERLSEEELYVVEVVDADHARYTAHYWSGGQPCESAYTVVYEVEMTRMG